MKITRLALVASPAAFLLAAVIHPPHAGDAGSWLDAASTGGGRFYLAHLLFLVGAVALVPAAWGMADLLAKSGVRRGRLAAILVGLGALGLVNLVGMDFLVWRLAESSIERSEMLAFLEDAVTNPAVIGPASALLGLLIAGNVLFAADLHRAKLIGAAPAALLATGPLLYFVLPVKPVSVTGAVFLLVGLTSVARACAEDHAPAPAVRRTGGTELARVGAG